MTGINPVQGEDYCWRSWILVPALLQSEPWKTNLPFQNLNFLFWKMRGRNTFRVTNWILQCYWGRWTTARSEAGQLQDHFSEEIWPSWPISQLKKIWILGTLAFLEEKQEYKNNNKWLPVLYLRKGEYRAWLQTANSWSILALIVAMGPGFPGPLVFKRSQIRSNLC